MKGLIKVKNLKWDAAKHFKQLVIEWMIDQEINTNEDVQQLFESTQSLKTDSESSDSDSNSDDDFKEKLRKRLSVYQADPIHEDSDEWE